MQKQAEKSKTLALARKKYDSTSTKQCDRLWILDSAIHLSLSLCDTRFLIPVIHFGKFEVYSRKVDEDCIQEDLQELQKRINKLADDEVDGQVADPVQVEAVVFSWNAL